MKHAAIYGPGPRRIWALYRGCDNKPAKVSDDLTHTKWDFVDCPDCLIAIEQYDYWLIKQQQQKQAYLDKLVEQGKPLP